MDEDTLVYEWQCALLSSDDSFVKRDLCVWVWRPVLA